MAMVLPELKVNFKAGQLFRHTDGGYYQYQKSVYFADDQAELVIYEHIWPFERSEWARRAHEFMAKFSPISESDLELAQKEPREKLQEQITQTRNARRAKK